MKVLCVFGTRPEAIKMAPVVKAFRNHPEKFETRVCVTAQHREMLDQVLDLFQIRPDHDLNLMRANQSLAAITASVITQLDQVLQQEKPDWILVQGDTTTAMAAALTGFYNRVRVGHIEAGLRTWDKAQPFPEEINRVLAGHLSDLHFAPTEQARQNLLREGINTDHVFVTGNTVIDALLDVADRPFSWADSALRDIPRDRKIILVTAHRRENFGAPLQNICEALADIAAQRDDIHIVYPVHLNPNVREVAHRRLGNISNITLLPPLEYLPMAHLLKTSWLVLTDSGGLQEEAPGLGKPVLVMRDVTERPEGVAAGTVKLVGTTRETIVGEVRCLLEDKSTYAQMSQAVNPYGDGHASQRIVDAIARHSW
ncbi:MAG: non-hydrolyzing UDP-N-acetylglucosamine 2-epimerase [Blastocatellia bacterium]